MGIRFDEPVGPPIGASFGASVGGALVEATVGSAVGLAVRFAVGFTDSDLVGKFDGALVGDVLGPSMPNQHVGSK